MNSTSPSPPPPPSSPSSPPAMNPSAPVFTPALKSNNETVNKILEQLNSSSKTISSINTKITAQAERRKTQQRLFIELTASVGKLQKLPFVDPSILNNINKKMQELEDNLKRIDGNVDTEQVDTDFIKQIQKLTSEVNNAVSSNENSTQVGGKKSKKSKKKTARYRKKGGYTYKRGSTRRPVTKRKQRRRR